MVWALRKLQGYVEGFSVTVYTNYSAPKWLYNLKDLAGRFSRLAIDLSVYKLDIVHYTETKQSFRFFVLPLERFWVDRTFIDSDLQHY